jgi:BASS family bile acid:Na+ symporter
MMLIVGLELTIADFRRVLALPRAVIVGTLGQLTLLPILSIGALSVFEVSPRIAAGVVLILAAPGGGISNVFTLLSGANTALSVTLTAIASLSAIVTLPLILAYGFRFLGGETSEISVPVLPMMAQLIVLVLVPIAAGMRLRVRNVGWAMRQGPRLRRLVLIAVVAVIGFGMSSDTRGLLGEAVGAMGVALAWTVFAMSLGYVLGRLAALDAADCFTLAIEFGVKNVGIAAIVAIATLDRPDLAVFAAAYIATGYPLAVLLSMGFRRVTAVPVA